MSPNDFADRAQHKLCLFDVDGTLSLARQVCLGHRVILAVVELVYFAECLAGND